MFRNYFSQNICHAALLAMAVVVAIPFLALPQPAHAALSWEFGFDSTVDNFGGTGSFTLGGDNSDDFDVEVFSFSGTCGFDGTDPYNCSFNKANVTSEIWDLNTDWSFDSLNIVARVFGAPQFIVQFSATTLTVTCVGNITALCDGTNSFANRSATFGEGAFLTPIHEIPEPSSIGLFAMGLAGLGVISWRRRRRTISA